MLPTLFTTSSIENLRIIAFFSLPEFATVAAVACFGYNLIASQSLLSIVAALRYLQMALV